LLVAGFAWLCEPAQAQTNAEARYTSPNFGYSIAWPMPWFALRAESDGTFDTLVLVDDQSSIQFSGARLGNASLQSIVEATVQSYREDPTLTNLTQLPASECAFPTDGYVACYRFDAVSGDGSVVGATSLFEARALGGGIVLQTIAGVREPHLAVYLSRWASIVVAAPGEPAPMPATGTDWEIVAIDGASYRVEPGVPALDRDLAIEGIEFGRRTLKAMGGTLSSDRLTVSVRVSASLDDPYLYGLTQNNGITVYTGSSIWPEISPIERVQGLVHEYFHLYQFDRLEAAQANAPAWFVEGSADAFGYLAASRLGVTDQLDFVRFALNRLNNDPVAGALCSYVSAETFPVEVYPLAYLAVQDLLARNGRSIEGLVQVFEEIGNGSSFETAFADTFGVAPDQFCVEVEAWRGTLAPVDNVPPDLLITAGSDLPSQVTLTSAPTQAQPGQQVFFAASTTAGANCQLEMSAGKRSGAIVAETFANGSGEAFWLVILPEDALPGEATVEISCGSETVQALLSIA
jgi:hypothetical protein